MNIDKLKTLEDAPQRVIFPNLDAALPALGKYQNIAGDDVEFVIHGIEEGEDGEPVINDEQWPDTHQVMLSRLTQKTNTGIDEDTKAIIYKQLTVGVVCWPMPTVESLLSDEKGKEMINAVMEKELNHRAVRILRNLEQGQYHTGVGEMPVTIESYASSSRGGTGGLYAAYDELFLKIKNAFNNQFPSFAKAKLNKTDLRKCLENAAYAGHFYEPVEMYGKNNDSLFEFALKAFIKLCVPNGLDATIFETWLATRGDASFSEPEIEETGIDLDELVAGLIAGDEEADDDESTADADEAGDDVDSVAVDADESEGDVIEEDDPELEEEEEESEEEDQA
jgi:hypothetical protein